MAVKVITEANFEAEVLKADKPVLLDFWASWCGPCRMLSPIVDEIAEENDAIIVGKVNVGDEMGLAQQFQVSSIPTVMLFRNGKVAARTMGVQPKEQLKAALGI